MKISKIEKVSFSGPVYNLELKSSRVEDDLFWIEGKSNIVTHNCFPKDMNAMLYLAEVLSVPVPTLAGAHTTNQIVRSNKDWERMQGRAVSKRDLDIEDIREVYPANIEGSEEFNSANQ
jgi:hypothetical protein